VLKAKHRSGAKALAIAQAQQFKDDDPNPWREDPLPLAEFVESEDHLSGGGKIKLYPEQQKDLEAFLGVDPKQIFAEDFQPQFNQAFLVWGKGCLGKDERLTDWGSGETKTAAEWAESGRSLLVLSWTGTAFVVTPASPVYLKGQDELFQITLTDGRSFTATAHHRCLTPDCWKVVGAMNVGDRLFVTGKPDGIVEYSAIAAIEACGSGDFYDLTVPGTHCYFDAQGILHHNSGKDTVTALVHCWIAHILLCLKNPQQFFGLVPGESIDIPVIAYSEHQAKYVYFAKFKNRLQTWPWLRRTIQTITEVDGDFWLREGGDYFHADHVELPFRINCWSLTTSLGSAEGKNIIFFILDELAAFTSPSKVNLAQSIHNLVVTSARSRFKKRWRGLTLSFPRHKGDYVMKTADRVDAGIIKDTYVSIKPTWVVVPHLSREDFRDDYDRDPEDADTKYGCNPPNAIDAYYRSPELLLLNASGSPLSLLQRHLGRTYDEDALTVLAEKGRSPILQVDEHHDPILNRYGFPYLAQWFRGKKDLRGHPYEYYCHVDLGLKNDAAGFAIGHLEELPSGKFLPTLDLAFRWTAAMFRDRGDVHRKGWFEDTVDQVETVVAAEIDLRTVREFLFYLKMARGFEIAVASFDGFNSAETMQELRKRSIPAVLWTVSKTDYDAFKSLVYTRQLQYFGYPILIEESMKLQLLNGSKVDAPRTKEGGEGGGATDSHKDVSDAAAAVVGRLAYMRDDSLPFEQLPEADEVLKLSPDFDLNIQTAPSGMSAAQEQLFSEFLR
jgi:hypothetical protein